MTTREDMIETANQAAFDRVMGNLPVDLMDDARMKNWAKHLANLAARAAIDAAYPQITTVEQLEALPVGTWLVAESSPRFYRRVIFATAKPGGIPALAWEGVVYAVDDIVSRYGLLTLVWQPAPVAEATT